MTLLLEDPEAVAVAIQCPTCGDDWAEKLQSAEPKLTNVERVIGASVCWYRCCRGHQFATFDPAV